MHNILMLRRLMMMIQPKASPVMPVCYHRLHKAVYSFLINQMGCWLVKKMHRTGWELNIKYGQKLYLKGKC